MVREHNSEVGVTRNTSFFNKIFQLIIVDGSYLSALILPKFQGLILKFYDVS